MQHLYEIISEVLADTIEDNVILSPEQEAILDQDIKASKNPKNLVDHEVAIKQIKWNDRALNTFHDVAVYLEDKYSAKTSILKG